MADNATPVNVPWVDGDELSLSVRVGACRVRIRPGEADVMAGGVYTDPTGKLPLRLLHVGGQVTLTQGRDVAGFLGLVSGVPTLELTLGTGRAFSLSIETGASDVEAELGGVSLSDVRIRQGAGKLEVSFDAPNPVEMSSLEIGVGAGGVEAEGLANANFTDLRVDSGAAALELEFDGALRRSCTARISGAMSGTTIVVPPTTPARITTEATLGAVDLGDGFTTREGAVWTEIDDGPMLQIHASVAMGALKLRTAS